MMTAERRKILEMLSKGVITADDAERLLDKLNTVGSETDPASRATTPEDNGPKKQRFLRIQVEKPGEKQTNIRIPLAFAAGAKLLGVLPTQVTDRLKESGVDLTMFSHMKDVDIQDICKNMHVDVEK